MAAIIQRESTEYVYIGVNGDQPVVDQEVAFLEAGIRPQEQDWVSGILVDNDQHALWADAASVASGQWFIAVLVGSFGGNTLTLSPGDYTVWVRLTDAIEQPVRIVPVTLEVQ